VGLRWCGVGIIKIWQRGGRLAEGTKTLADEVAVFETQRHFCRKNSDGPAIHPKPRFWLGVNLAETGRAADSE
jgi:hypothetical protein